MGTILENVFYGCCTLMCLMITFWFVLGFINLIVEIYKGIWGRNKKKMTYKELYESAINKLEKSEITLGEFEKMIEPLNTEIGGDKDTISRKAAIDALNRECCCGAVIDHCGLETAMDIINELPPAQPKRGKWIKISPANIYECSECGKHVMTNDICAYDFCHGCGAEMEVTT